MKINRNFFRFFAYSLEIIILYVLQSTPKFIPEIFGGKPLLLLCVAFTVAARENVVPSIIFAAVCGVFTDIATGTSIGFFAILLTIVCYFETNIFKTYFVSSFRTVMIFAAAAGTALVCLYFLIFTVFAGIPEWGTLFVNHYISRIIYTILAVAPLYFLNGFLYKTLYD